MLEEGALGSSAAEVKEGKIQLTKVRSVTSKVP